MKKIFFFGLLLCSMVSRAEIIDKSIRYYLLEDPREYNVCLPTNYSADQSYALMVFLHELKGRIHDDYHQQMAQRFADKYNWIIAMPQSESYFNIDPSLLGGASGLENVLDIPAWNSGMSSNTMKGAINTLLEANISNRFALAAAKLYVAEELYRWENAEDEEFIIDMLNEILDDYPIAQDSVFLAGMSMGGFMTHRMLIHQGQYFNAVVAISGLIGDALMDTQPQHGAHPRIMCVHGTADQIVGYSGYASIYGLSAQMGLSAEETVEYWRQYNDCDATSAPVYYYPDTVQDGLSFERYTYGNGIDGSEVCFIKVNNGRHEWYDDLAGKDVDYLEEIYRFYTNNMVQPTYPTDVMDTDVDLPQPEKVLINGQLFIIIGEHRYDMMGNEYAL